MSKYYIRHISGEVGRLNAMYLMERRRWWFDRRIVRTSFFDSTYTAERAYLSKIKKDLDQDDSNTSK